MYILTGNQVREADRYTIEHAPIASIDLMENAAIKCCEWLTNHFGEQVPFVVICGSGNNGGDGLAVSRLLLQKGYLVKICMLQSSNNLSEDCAENFRRLKTLAPQLIIEINNVDQLPLFDHGTVLIDAIFGIGLSKPVTGLTAAVIDWMNATGFQIISIDLPSGIYSDKSSINSDNKIVKANYTLTFQFLKRALLVGENFDFLGQVELLDIGILPDAVTHLNLNQFQANLVYIKSIYKPKWEFSHKGNFGHSLLITGGEGKLGAAILAAKANLRSGGGLLTLLVPAGGLSVVQSAVPEAMALTYYSEQPILPGLENFKAIGIGPGIGISDSSKKLVDQLLHKAHRNVVWDADALNVLSENKSWYDRLVEANILTPHPGEFRRLVGTWQNDFEKLDLQQAFAIKYKVYVILKGKNTSIACPDGQMWFNATGNPGMAKGGSGDILTGLLTGLLSSGYSAFESCIMGTWLHGLAGDLAAIELSKEAMQANDIINHLPKAWMEVQQTK